VCPELTLARNGLLRTVDVSGLGGSGRYVAFGKTTDQEADRRALFPLTPFFSLNVYLSASGKPSRWIRKRYRELLCNAAPLASNPYRLSRHSLVAAELARKAPRLAPPLRGIARSSGCPAFASPTG